jgi:hypothetical protein
MSVTTGPKKGLIIAAADGDAFGTYFRGLLRALDTLLLPYVIDHALTAPPGSPANGAAYIVAASPSGAWSGHAGAIAVWSTDNPAAPSGEWEFYAPETGWVVFSRNGSQQLRWTGSVWSTLPSPFDISTFAAGVGTNNQVLLRVAVARAVTFPAGASLAQAVASATATGSTTFTLKKNGSSFATVNFAASASSGIWTQASDATFAAGDVLEIDGPATADATLADVGITLAGVRA